MAAGVDQLSEANMLRSKMGSLEGLGLRSI